MDPNLKNLKVGGSTFKVGTFILISSKKERIAKLSGIIPKGGNKKYPHWPMIEV